MSTQLAAAERERLIAKGIEAADQALVLDQDGLDALTCKSLLLRLQATLETNDRKCAALIAQADELRDRALTLAKRHPRG